MLDTQTTNHRRKLFIVADQSILSELKESHLPILKMNEELEPIFTEEIQANDLFDCQQMPYAIFVLMKSNKAAPDQLQHQNEQSLLYSNAIRFLHEHGGKAAILDYTEESYENNRPLLLLYLQFYPCYKHFFAILLS